MTLLKRKALRKIIITAFVFFVVLTIYMIPTNNKKDNEITYHYIDTKHISVYLLNDYNQLTKVDFKIRGTNTESIRKDFWITDFNNDEKEQIEKDKKYLEKNL